MNVRKEVVFLVVALIFLVISCGVCMVGGKAALSAGVDRTEETVFRGEEEQELTRLRCESTEVVVIDQGRDINSVSGTGSYSTVLRVADASGTERSLSTDHYWWPSDPAMQEGATALGSVETMQGVLNVYISPDVYEPAFADRVTSCLEARRVELLEAANRTRDVYRTLDTVVVWRRGIHPTGEYGPPL